MRFIVDANLPFSLVKLLRDHGHTADHVGGLDIGKDASDTVIAQWADTQNAVVVSKDADFRLLQIATDRPPRLLLVGTGNISNRDLRALVERFLTQIEVELHQRRFVMFDEHSLIVESSPDEM
ncbi:MAG: DUF5615 family PIN-like protein [Cellulomonadaceae bacterium]|jgi:predicted nuclease of predicted toxin-antitoxin system|nr:DUF5615 family PIN-like protein [Cellulomonadaceae bacterium]